MNKINLLNVIIITYLKFENKREEYINFKYAIDNNAKTARWLRSLKFANRGWVTIESDGDIHEEQNISYSFSNLFYLYYPLIVSVFWLFVSLIFDSRNNNEWRLS